MMCPGPGAESVVARQVPVHDVPPAGAQPEIDRRGVDDDRVADRDRPVSCVSTYAALGLAVEIDHDALQPGPLLEDLARPSPS